MANVSNPLIRRYMPNSRFTDGAFKDTHEVKLIVDDFGESITDKESYRLSLVNGAGASGSGALNPACYAFPDGKYDIHKDISYVLRPDLSPVQIDMYIKAMQSSLESSDASLKDKIEKDIQYAEAIAKRAAAEKSNSETSED